MKFFFCEKCGKRLTDQDIHAVKACNKQVKGVICSNCAEGVMTVEFEAISPDMIEQFRMEQRERQRRGSPPSAPSLTVPPSPQDHPRRATPASNPKLPAARRRPGSGLRKAESQLTTISGPDDTGAGPSRMSLIPLTLALIATVMGLILVFTKEEDPTIIKNRVEAPDVPQAPLELANGVESRPKSNALPAPEEKRPRQSNPNTPREPTSKGPSHSVEFLATNGVQLSGENWIAQEAGTELEVSNDPPAVAAFHFDLSKLDATPVSLRLKFRPSDLQNQKSRLFIGRYRADAWPPKTPKGAEVQFLASIDLSSAAPIEVDISKVLVSSRNLTEGLVICLRPGNKDAKLTLYSAKASEAQRPRLIVELVAASEQ